MILTTETPALARGKITQAAPGRVVFVPQGTNYELHLNTPAYNGLLDTLVEGVVQVKARKVWTVPSGGNFISPIFGTPRTIQGRIRWLDQRAMVVQAGCPVHVILPADSPAYDLANGPLTVGVMVNIVAQPGASFEPA